MPQVNLAEFRVHLRTWATHLSSSSAQIPVLVSRICGALGVSVQKSETVPRYKAYLSIDPSKDAGAVVLLPAKNIGSFERFCVAHELGHYLLIMNFELTPQTRSEYWRHEALCDDFARHLLMPDDYMRSLEHISRRADEYLDRCRDVSQLTRVPWMQAAIRIAEVDKYAVYLRCKRNVPDAFKIVSTSLPKQKGRGKIIGTRLPLYHSLHHLLKKSAEMGQRVRGEVTDVVAEIEDIKRLIPMGSFSAIAEAESGVFPDVKIAISTT